MRVSEELKVWENKRSGCGGGEKGRERRFWTKLMEMLCEMHHRSEVALEVESR